MSEAVVVLTCACLLALIVRMERRRYRERMGRVRVRVVEIPWNAEQVVGMEYVPEDSGEPVAK